MNRGDVSAPRLDLIPSGATIVLLHPAGLDGSVWGPVVDALPPEASLVVVTPDLPGHGSFADQLPMADDYLKDSADLISAIIDDLRLRGLLIRPVLVVGLSLGGVVARELVTRYPELVDALVLCDTLHALPGHARAALRERATRTRTVPAPSMIDETLQRWFGDLDRSAILTVRTTVRDILGRARTESTARVWEALAEMQDSYDAIDVPVLVACGSDDISTPEHMNQALAASIHGARYVAIPDAGHLAPIEMPEQFAIILTRFLSTLERPLNHDKQ